MELFRIDGYWKDDKTEFENYLVSAGDEVLENDDDIFFYGMSETILKDAIEKGENTINDFVVTAYRLEN